MLAGNEEEDKAVEVTAEENSAAPTNDPDQSERKGAFSKLNVVKPHTQSVYVLYVYY